jgi:D-3-phosphoglycerate dehydrogenase
MLVRDTFEIIKCTKEFGISQLITVELRGKKAWNSGVRKYWSSISIIAEALGMKVYFYDVVDKALDAKNLLRITFFVGCG